MIVVLIILPKKYGKKGGKNNEVLLNPHPMPQKAILLLGETARKICLLPDGLKKNLILNQKLGLNATESEEKEV